MSILKCKQCPSSRRHKVGFIYAYECKRLGRPVNPEMKPYNCPLPNGLSTREELMEWCKHISG